MITEEKVRLYARFKGDIEGYARSTARHANSAISDGEWAEIYELLAGLSLAKHGLASPSFVSEIEARLAAQTCDEETRGLMRRIAAERNL